jgi:type IV secretion system protein VirB6
MFASLLLQAVRSYAAQTAARGSAILTVDAFDMMLIAGLVLLILRQVMPIAGSLAGGVALSTFGSMSRTLDWAARTGRKFAKPLGEFAVPKAYHTVATSPVAFRERPTDSPN